MLRPRPHLHDPDAERGVGLGDARKALPLGHAPTTGVRRNSPPAVPPQLRVAEGPIRRTREGGSEWEPIKILLGGYGDSNKTNTASNTRLRLTTQVGQVHVATGVPLDLGTNKQPSEPKHTNTHSGNLHGLLPVLHRSD
jgi:hypothetical protein